jgi:ribA/ribD-fused uncharacterized protein
MKIISCVFIFVVFFKVYAAGGIVIDPWTAIQSIRSMQARDEQVRAFRRDFVPEIQAKKSTLGTTYEAIATLGLLADAINGITTLNHDRLNHLKGAALGTRLPALPTSPDAFYHYGTREYLQSLFKAITMGIGYDKGVIKPSTPLSQKEMDTYRGIIRSVNPYFDAASQKPDPTHLRISAGLSPAEIQSHIDKAHELMCAPITSTPKVFPTVFSSTDGENEIRFYNKDEHGYEFANYYDAAIVVPMNIKHPSTRIILDLSRTSFVRTENLFQAVKYFILTGQLPDMQFFASIYARGAFDAAKISSAQTVGTSNLPILPGMQEYWDTIKNSIMLEAVKAKFSQHAHLAALLLSTDDNTLVENAVRFDGYWGRDGGLDSTGKSIGESTRGGNWLGKALVQVRAMLRTGTLPIASQATPGTAVISLPTAQALPEAKKREVETFIKSYQPGFTLPTVATTAAAGHPLTAVQPSFQEIKTLISSVDGSCTWDCGNGEFGSMQADKGALKIVCKSSKNPSVLSNVKAFLTANSILFIEGTDRQRQPLLQIGSQELKKFKPLIVASPTIQPWILNVSGNPNKTPQQIAAQTAIAQGGAAATSAGVVPTVPHTLTGSASVAVGAPPPPPMVTSPPAIDWTAIQQAVRDDFIYSDGHSIYIMSRHSTKALEDYLRTNRVPYDNLDTAIKIPLLVNSPRDLALFAAIPNSLMATLSQLPIPIMYEYKDGQYYLKVTYHPDAEAIAIKVNAALGGVQCWGDATRGIYFSPSAQNYLRSTPNS